MERLFDLARQQAEQRPGSILLAAKANGIWQTLSCKDVMWQADDFAERLLTLGIRHEPGLDIAEREKIALISPNRPEWVIADLAVQQTGAVLTPLYPTISLSEFTFIMNEAAVRIALFANRELWERFQPAFKDIPGLQHVLTFDEVEGATHWKSLPKDTGAPRKRLEVIEQLVPEDIATIIYTSGTTGKPKGVMLRHSNIVSNVKDCMPIFHFAKTDDRALSFLPLNHIFEKTLTYIYIHAGLSIYYAESLETIGDNLREVKPMVFTCVPRLLEKVYEKIMAKGMALKGLKRAFFFWALALGKKYDPASPGGFFYRLQLKLANKLVFNQWRAALGGRIKAVVSGSAPLQSRLIRIFCAAQIPIMEGYGLTETSPVVSVNRLEPSDRRVGTVGPPIRHVEVRIASDGEILCRGPNVMAGYYQNPELTASAIDADGWFHTGDIGVWEADRFLKITDRKKEMFKTSGGKYVAPQVIENKLRESALINQIMVLGENQKFVGALIVPNFDALRHRLADTLANTPLDNAKLAQHPEAIRLIRAQIDRYNSQFSHTEQIKKFHLIPEEWTTENGILTPKLSLRRKVATERYADEIAAMYHN